LRCRHALVYKWWNHDGGRLFHNPFWAHVEMDLKTRQIVERDNLLPTPESLYKMTDPDWMYEHLKDDLALQLYLYTRGLTSDVNWREVEKLCLALNLDPPVHGSTSQARSSLRYVLDRYGFAATKHILTKTRSFTERTGKELLVILFDPSRVMRPLLESKERYDQEVVDFLEKENFLYFDMNLVHVKDYKAFNLPVNDYLKRYFSGHYSPAGNHFFAFSIKDVLVNWLDPKPITYRTDPDRLDDFESYIIP